ncbi:DUF885 family protein, partial [Parasphingorhabdus sp.]|uniref:DUF885 domain-containing protein n=1 Tax=Parasphingorhabdus sp. TaxID=2709688 RepID=UPI003593128F
MRYLLLTAASVLALTAVAPAGFAQTSTVETPAKEDADARLSAFFKDYDDQELSHSPISKAYRGIRDDDYGKWDDASDAAEIAQYERNQAAFAKMEAEFDQSQLNEDSQLSYRLFQARAERADNAFPFRRNAYIFDQMNGAQSQVPAFLINIHRVANKTDAQAYVSRLEGAGPMIGSLVAQSAERAADGIIVPDWVFPYVIADAKNVIKGAPFGEGEDSPILADLKQKVAALDIPEAEKAELIAGGEAAMISSLKPAYEKLITEMERQQAMAVDGDGIWRLKDGAAYYAERLNNYTTTDLTADEIHQIGLDNVERIHGLMRKIMADVGFEGSLQDFFQHLRTGDEFYYETREAYLADVDSKLAAMTEKLPAFFNTLPKAPLVIKPVEAFREKSAGKAFYNSPAPDGSRPGTYYVNLYNLRSMSKTELEALAYHEGLPGHHLQRTIQTELGDLPPFRRFGGWTAYTEGWGLYSEELGKDMGFYEDPYSDFGR